MEEKNNKVTRDTKLKERSKETFNETKKRKPYDRKNEKKENELKEEKQ